MLCGQLYDLRSYDPGIYPEGYVPNTQRVARPPQLCPISPHIKFLDIYCHDSRFLTQDPLTGILASHVILVFVYKLLCLEVVGYLGLSCSSVINFSVYCCTHSGPSSSVHLARLRQPVTYMPIHLYSSLWFSFLSSSLSSLRL